ncbi:transposase, partial [Salmonella enterica]|nr:transposase [Salmonella enterica]EDG7557167.1 IS256-like element ISSoEn2 family transposase [Salmonella enterica subsp. enterica serovar Poona]EKR1710347.1 transposase [Salmonella enterica subsp. enterica serovar Carrau]EAV0794133.1 transposase [Salmonella enterica]EBA1300687.1 transposase [Salmonella enterica]
KAVTRDLKAIYLEAFSSVRDNRYPQIILSWQANWANLATFFAYPTDIRKVIHTTNAIESLNSVIRHAIKKRKVFPTDDPVKKVVWLAIQAASQKWTMPLRDWRMAMSRFIIGFGERLDGHL